MKGTDVLDLYFKSNTHFITKHHIDSYNQFTNTTIKKVIDSMNPFNIPKYDETGKIRHEIKVTVTDIWFTPYTMLPNECRMKNKSYVSELRGNISVAVTEKNATKTKVLKDIFLCHIPIMLQSDLCGLKGKDLREAGECPLDQGGYFVIDGKEKVIVAQERNVNNKLFVTAARDLDKYIWQAFMRCTSETDSVFPKTLWLYVKKTGEVVVKVPHIDKEIPLFILFRALGIESDLDILTHICPDGLDDNTPITDYLRPTIIDAKLYGQKEALAYIAPFTDFKTLENVMYIFFEDFLPNSPPTLVDKAKMLGETVRQLVEVGIGARQESDRDNYMTKRVGISGFLLGDIFKDFYNNFRVETMKKIDNKYEFGTNFDNIANIVNDSNKVEIFSASEKFTWGLIKSLKGNWGLSNDSTKQGIVQDLNRISYMGFISHLRRVNAPMDTSIKLRAPHQLETSQYGMMCPCESPDGASVGLLKNMAVLCHITSGVPGQVILEALDAAKFAVRFVKDIDVSASTTSTKLRINNNWIGMVDDPKSIVKYIRLLRRNGLISVFVSVSWNVFDNYINVLTESGRCCRPLFIAGQPVVKGSWRELVIGKANVDRVPNEFHETFISPFNASARASLKDVFKHLKENAGVIEFLDVEETNYSLIAMDHASVVEETTHVEIHPSTVFSVYSSTIPLPNHNQAPRNIFSGAQGKQAIGVYATSFNNRIDTMSYLLHYPQRPLVCTRYSDYLGANRLPNGENLIVGIMTYTGYNMEDSIMINQGSIDRGMFNLTYFKSYISSETIEKDPKSKKETNIFFANPNVLKVTKDVKLTRWADYSKLDENGMPKLESYMDEDDCIIGKCIKSVEYKENGDPSKDIYVERTESTSYQSKCEIVDKTTVGFVDKLVMFENDKGEKLAKLRMRKVRLPELGDKMACYSDDTQVLTDQGWIGWDQLTMGHRVASLNQRFELVYDHPINIFHYDYKGEMKHVCSDNVDIFVTPNHRLYVSRPNASTYEFVEAQNMTGVYIVPLAANEYHGNSNMTATELYLFGIMFRHGKTENGSLFIDSVHGEKLSKHGIKYKESGPSTLTIIHDVCQDLVDMLATTEHKLPDFVWDLGMCEASVLLEGILDGDVIIHGIECSVGELQRLALHAGTSATFRGTILTINKDSHSTISSRDLYIEYDGKVHCCEMPTGIVYVRRQGKAAFCGNSRHGQKGVIGAIIPTEAMPFTKDGLVPDIIVNPHAFPSRMTIGHLIECVLAKAGSCEGFYADGTPFEDQDFDSTAAVLNKYGLERNGDDVLYNGITGEQMECDIFIGPTYYFRLKHMVSDKINSRHSGQVVGMTQQPTKGRGNGGGLRVGEMETNVLISYGISAFTKESMMERSDKYKVAVARGSGLIVPVNEKKRIATEPYSCVKIPYASKQLILELEAMSIGTRILTAEDPEQDGDGDNDLDDDVVDKEAAGPIDDTTMNILRMYAMT